MNVLGEIREAERGWLCVYGEVEGSYGEDGTGCFAAVRYLEYCAIRTEGVGFRVAFVLEDEDIRH